MVPGPSNITATVYLNLPPGELTTMLIYLVLAGVGALVVGFVVGEVVHLFNERSANATFRTVMQQMAQTTITAVESIKETTVTGINAIMDMSTLNDVYNIARNKVNQNSQSSQQQSQQK